MRFYFSILSLFLLWIPGFATHIVGGNFEVTQTGANSFDVSLVIFRDCSPNTASLHDMYVSAFDPITKDTIDQTLIPRPNGQKLNLGDECYTPTSLCVEEYHFEGNLTLPNNPNGYLIVAQLCCRNHAIDNITTPGDAGMTWTAQIPDPVIQNNTPNLGPYPSDGFLCLDILREMDLSATDSDGDSLYYQLQTPLNAPSIMQNVKPPFAPPYGAVNWSTGYSTNNAIHGNPALQIDPTTGLLRCKASEIGLFVFAYSVSEYRNGIKIGEVQRDLQLQVLPCEINQTPQFTAPKQTSYEVGPNELMCIPVALVDSNSTDSLYVFSEFTSTPDIDGTSEPTRLRKSGAGTLSASICYEPNCIDVGLINKMLIDITGISYNCRKTDTIYQSIEISLQVIPENVEALFPNVFTPNNDGINDFFTLIDPKAIPCVDGMNIKIFNRWGVLVYENTGQNFNWDGKFNGNDVSDGVYFFTIEGFYSDKSFTYKNFLTLNR